MARLFHLLLVLCLSLANAVASVPVRVCLVSGELVAGDGHPGEPCEAAAGCCSDCPATPAPPATTCCLEVDWTADLTRGAQALRPAPPAEPLPLPLATWAIPGAESRNRHMTCAGRSEIPAWTEPDLLATLGIWRL